MISIIIPVYNHAKQLEKCLDSILKQSISNYELIIINDRSSDRFSSLLRKYQKKFGYKLEIYHNQVNHGAPYCRNKGFKKSKGEYLLFCDADIEMKPNMLELMLKTLQNHTEASYAYSAHMFGHKKFKCLKFDPEKLKQMPFIHTTSLIKRKDFPKNGWDESLKRLQDWDIWLTMLEEGHTGVGIDEVLFKIKPGGTMSSWMPSFAYSFFPFLPKIQRYKKAIKIIKNKHNIN